MREKIELKSNIFKKVDSDDLILGVYEVHIILNYLAFPFLTFLSFFRRSKSFTTNDSQFLTTLNDILRHGQIQRYFFFCFFKSAKILSVM